MNNTGDVKTFILNGTEPTQSMRYVWQWWDDSVTVTTSGTASKFLNIGGNPSDGYQVHFSCSAVNDAGASSSFNGAFVVNNSPSLVPGLTNLTSNGDDFNFTTRARLVAYDLESQIPLGFEWFAGGVSLGPGVSTAVGAVGGTYAGTYVGSRTGVANYLDYEVTSNGSLTCRIHDTQGGTTAVNFYLFGQEPARSFSAPIALGFGDSVDASSSSSVRIGATQSVEFRVYTQDNSNPTLFAWTFHGTNGWSSTSYSSGTTTALENGAYLNSAVKSIAAETAGQKEAECVITDTLTGRGNTALIPVTLISNNLPVIADVVITPSAPAVGDTLKFTVTATDADNDLLLYEWNFYDASTILYGRTAYISSSYLSMGQTVRATLTVTDRLGDSVSLNVESDGLT